MKTTTWILALALVAMTLAGCADAPSSTLRLTARGDAEEHSLPFDAAARPAASHYEAAGATHPGFYSAFDQLAQAGQAGLLTFNASYDARFGFFLADINGLSAPDAFWRLVVDGEEAMTGMGDVQVRAGTVVEWSFTTVQATGEPSTDSPARAGDTASQTAVTIEAPASTLDADLLVTGTATGPVTLMAKRGADRSAVPVDWDDGAWSATVPLDFGRTELLASTADGASATWAVTRLASATFIVKPTAEPTKAGREEVVQFDVDGFPSLPAYVDTDVGHPGHYTVHDLMTDWSAQTGAAVEYQYSSGLGYAPVEIDGVGNPLGLGSTTPPWWCYKVNGESADLGISLQAAMPGDVVEWEYGGCA